MHERSFLGHLLACAAGAGIDNVVRQVVNVALALAAIKTLGQGPAAATAGEDWAQWAVMLFILPFILLAPTAGSLGDRLPKHRIVRWARLVDLPVCALAVWGFAVHDVTIMLGAVCLLGVTSAFFAPVKLAIIPELVPPERLAQANAQLNAVTVAAILGGAGLAAATDPAVATWIARTTESTLSAHTIATLILAGLCTLVCGIGIIGAFLIPRLPAQDPQAPIAGPWALRRQIGSLGSAPGLWAPALSLAGFWALGTVASVGLVAVAQKVYLLDMAGISLLLLMLVGGVAVGSLAAPRVMAKPYPAGLPVAGALLAGLGFLAAGWLAWHHLHVPLALRPEGWLTFGLLLSVTGIGAGLWEVPLVVLMQERAPAARRNLILSGTSALTCVGVLLAGAAMLGLGALGWDNSRKFMAVGGLVATLALVAGIHYRTQMVGWLLISTVRRIFTLRVTDAHHVPATGGCLVICNHQSYADGFILAASLPRRCRALVYGRYWKWPVVGGLLRAGNCISVMGDGPRAALVGAIDAAVAAAQAGDCVLIFPEGKLSRSGSIDSFKAGMERIAKRAGVPVIPAHLDGVYGTWMARMPKALRGRGWLPRLGRPVTVRFGTALPAGTTAAEARQEVLRLGNLQACARAAVDHRSLDAAFLGIARRQPLAMAVQDQGGALPYWKLGAVARALIPRMGLPADEPRVGVMLPPGRAGAVVNLALAMAGRTAVNLNHTTGPVQVERMCTIAGVRTVISSKLYLRRIGEPVLPGRVLHAEDLLPGLSTLTVLGHALRHLLLPIRWQQGSSPDAVAAVVFSSGSTGDPKGVELTHRQILANCTAVAEGLRVIGGQDVLLNPLPLFHSFGLVPGTWLGLTQGISTANHPDPNDAKAIGDLFQAAKATFLISTPTFVRGYLRRIEPAQFASMRFAVVGAERCPAELRAQFRERYGADLLEGYGCTELGPVVSISLPTVEHGGEKEVRQRDGSVGRPLPGIMVRAIDPETRADLPPGSDGLLVVLSSARMRGYLGRDDLTTKALIGEGYSTGDIGKVDADGFVFITGRLARFAKIAGEMVPLDSVEAALQLAAGEDTELAVAAVPDPARGERLVVMHTGPAAEWNDVIERCTALPALWRPKASSFIAVADIPKLGTGKRDLAALKRLACERSAVDGR